MESIDQNYKKNRFFYIVGGLLGLSLVIIVHEFGHFLFAKLFGVGTPVFSIGFGPPLAQIAIGKTIFQLSLLPLGGYVEMNPTELEALPYLYKMIVVLAGVAFNFLFTYIVLLTFILRTSHQPTPVIEHVVSNSPAEKAGLQPQDTIVALDNHPIDSNMNTFLHKINVSPGKTITITVQREGLTKDITAHLTTPHPLFGQDSGWLGIELQTVEIAAPSVGAALKSGKRELIGTLQAMAQATATVAQTKGQQGIIGPIGIINMIGRSLSIGPRFFFMILAIISLNIGIFNLIPLPFLDGGKAFIFTLETVTGPIPEQILWYITMLFLIFFFLLLFFITTQDIKSLQKR